MNGLLWAAVLGLLVWLCRVRPPGPQPLPVPGSGMPARPTVPRLAHFAIVRRGSGGGRSGRSAATEDGDMFLAGLVSDVLMGLGLLTLMFLSALVTVVGAAVLWLVRSGQCPGLTELLTRGRDRTDPSRAHEM